MFVLVVVVMPVVREVRIHPEVWTSVVSSGSGDYYTHLTGIVESWCP